MAETDFNAEMRSVIDPRWVVVAHADDLPKAGDFLARAVAGRSLLLVRQSDGGVVTFENLCTHQALPLSGSRQRGNVRAFECPFHGWTFALDGRCLQPMQRSARGDRRSDVRDLVARPTLSLGGLIVSSWAPGEAVPQALVDSGRRAQLPGTTRRRISTQRPWKDVLVSELDVPASTLVFPTTVLRTGEDGAVRSVVSVLPRSATATDVVRIECGGSAMARDEGSDHPQRYGEREAFWCAHALASSTTNAS